MAKGRKPTRKPKKVESVGTEASTDLGKPDDKYFRFCFAFTVAGYSVEDLDRDKKADLMSALYKRRHFTRQQLNQAGRHGLGSEFMPKKSIRPSIPQQFSDQSKFMVLRYSDRLPMVGTYIGDLFHVLWIEQNYGDVYDHGS